MLQSDFPKIGAPAIRALHNANIKNLKSLPKYTKSEVLSLHGMGPKAIKILIIALKEKGLSFK